MSRKTKIGSAASPAYASSSPTFSIQDAPHVEKPLSLTCGVCGVSGRYQVGTVTIDPEIVRTSESGSLEKAVGFTGYFRCRKCDAGGPWELPSLTLLRIMGMVGAAINGSEDVPLILGASATFDKRIFRYGTECEAHLKSLIEREPERSFLWVRLGNFYSHARKQEWAEEAYRRALELDPKDIEAHSMFGQLLVDTDRYLEAVPHWHGVLKNVQQATQVRKELRKELVYGAIDSLLEARARSNGQIELLPTPDASELAKGRKDGEETAIVELRELDLSTDEGLDELCDMFLEPPRRLRDFVLPRKRPERDWSDDGVTAPIRRTAFAVGRNDPCPCNSGLKYKKCCGR